MRALDGEVRISLKSLCSQLELLNMEPTFLNRNVNEGFSGGEKKRNEILQLAVLEVGPCIDIFTFPTFS